MTKQEILEIIFPCTSAKFFGVDKTSYMYKQAEEVAEKLAQKIQVYLPEYPKGEKPKEGFFDNIKFPE